MCVNLCRMSKGVGAVGRNGTPFGGGLAMGLLDWPVHALACAWGWWGFACSELGFLSELTSQIAPKTCSNERRSRRMWEHKLSGVSLIFHSLALKGYSVDPVTSAWFVNSDRTRPCEGYLSVPKELPLPFQRTKYFGLHPKGLTLYCRPTHLIVMRGNSLGRDWGSWDRFLLTNRRFLSMSFIRAVAYSTFCQLWRLLLPSVTVMKPMSDPCWQCQQNSSAILRVANAPEAE